MFEVFADFPTPPNEMVMSHNLHFAVDFLSAGDNLFFTKYFQ